MRTMQQWIADRGYDAAENRWIPNDTISSNWRLAYDAIIAEAPGAVEVSLGSRGREITTPQACEPVVVVSTRRTFHAVSGGFPPLIVWRRTPLRCRSTVGAITRTVPQYIARVALERVTLRFPTMPKLPYSEGSRIFCPIDRPGVTVM